MQSLMGETPKTALHRLLFYIIHLWVIHFAAIVLSLPKYGITAVILPYLNKSSMPVNYGYSLPHVYLIWIIIIIILYPICHRFANFKSHHKYWWLNYL
ncbi:hypothetical protein [Moorena producens]|uniref:hypothetical protein n=1 Tax=Moorena producens TaxID=1155739 RepID=UPI000A809C9E|nr:hypothetical protein [Moorena producens]